MQAIRVERRRPLDPRWLQHLTLLGAVGFLLSWVVAARPEAARQLTASFPVSFLAPPSMPAREWQPVRVPVRTSTVRDPAPPASVGVPRVAEQGASVAAAAAQFGEQWVQTHRRTVLMSAPEDSSARELDVPQWSYLRVFETRPDGWLRVGYGSDTKGQPASVAWIPSSDIGVSGPPPRFVTSVRDVPLWSTDDTNAESLAIAPRFATLELAGAERNGRVAVHLADGERSDGPLAWVDWDAVIGGRGPDERDLPLARPFSPFAGRVQLDVPYRTQLDGSISAQANCGPASISMALESFGIRIPTTQARAIATRSMGIFSPWSGTTLEALRDVARTHELEALDLHQNGRYKRWTLDDVRRHLRAGHPVIPQLRYRAMPGREWTWAGFDHYVVISGMVGDDFIIVDPVPENGRGERTITAQQLQRAWQSSDHPGAALAVARPL